MTTPVTNFTSDLAGDQSAPAINFAGNHVGDQTSPVTTPVTNFIGDLAGDQSAPVTNFTSHHAGDQFQHWPPRWPHFTGDQAGDQSAPVTKLHRWPHFTGDQRSPVNFTGAQTSLVTKVHRWRIFTGVRDYTGYQKSPACLKEAGQLALPLNKISFRLRAAGGSVQISGHGLRNFHLTWTRHFAPAKSRKPGLHVGISLVWTNRSSFPRLERGCFQLPSLMRHPFSEPPLPPRLRGTRAMGGWSEAVDPQHTRDSLLQQLHRPG